MSCVRHSLVCCIVIDVLLPNLKYYLTIIPLALMASESIAHEAEPVRARGNNRFSKIQLNGKKYRE